MTSRTVPERYVTLCLRVGAHLEDFVDAYIGPAALKDEALSGGPHDPRDLREEAVSLIDSLPGEDLEEDRAHWLLGQLRALECITGRLAGDAVSWSDEVERCFGIRPVHVDEEVFRESHKTLDDVLPGNGDVATRYNAWIDASQVPRESIPRALEVISAELHRRARRIVELPSGESVEYETVEGEPWQAFNWYRGDLHSLVQVNLDLPLSSVDVIELVAHETYPGHHTERACKEKLLYRDGSRLEMCVMIVSAPEAVVAEGIATNALDVVLGDDGFEALRGVAEDLALQLDAEVADIVHVETARLLDAAANAARMLHEDGMTTQEAEAYLREWALDSPERAAKMVSFLMDPGSWTYMTAYTDGRRLCRSFMDRDPNGFKRLLTEQLTVSSLLTSDPTLS